MRRTPSVRERRVGHRRPMLESRPNEDQPRTAPAGDLNGRRRRARRRRRPLARSSLIPLLHLRDPGGRSPSSAFVGVVGVFAYYSQGLPPTRPTSSRSPSTSESTIYDRTARPAGHFGSGERPPAVVTFDQISAGPGRRHDRGRGQDLLDQHRLRPAGHRLGRHRLHPGRPPRRLDHHPAAGAPAPARPGPGPGPQPARSSARSRRSSSRSA